MKFAISRTSLKEILKDILKGRRINDERRKTEMSEDMMSLAKSEHCVIQFDLLGKQNEMIKNKNT